MKYTKNPISIEAGRWFKNSGDLMAAMMRHRAGIMSQQYVLGFAFNLALTQVLMIRKNRPLWQKGLLNGIGGKVEPREIESLAMVREFKEETGVETISLEWIPVADIRGDFGNVGVYKTLLSDQRFDAAKSMTDEEVTKVHLASVFALRLQMIGNIPHLLGLCMDDTLDGVQVIHYKPS